MSKPVEQEIPEIFGAVLSEGRTAKGLSRSDLAGVLCLAARHIEQLEEGGESAFFSKAHKVQVAKKVADHLGLSYEKILSSVTVLPAKDAVDQIVSTDQVVDKVTQSSNVELPTYSEQEKNGLDKPATKKNLFVWLGLLGVVGLIAYWKLIPSPSQIYQESSVKELKKDTSVVDTAKVKEEPKPEAKEVIPKQEELTQTNSENSCDIPIQSVPQFVAPRASYLGNFVYLVSRADQKVCVIDGKGTKQNIYLALGEKKNVPGVPPFVVLAKDFSTLNVYYQGWRAIPSSATTNTLKVQEVPVYVKPAEDASANPKSYSPE